MGVCSRITRATTNTAARTRTRPSAAGPTAATSSATSRNKMSSSTSCRAARLRLHPRRHLQLRLRRRPRQRRRQHPHPPRHALLLTVVSRRAASHLGSIPEIPRLAASRQTCPTREHSLRRWARRVPMAFLIRPSRPWWAKCIQWTFGLRMMIPPGTIIFRLPLRGCPLSRS